MKHFQMTQPTLILNLSASLCAVALVAWRLQVPIWRRVILVAGFPLSVVVSGGLAGALPSPATAGVTDQPRSPL